MKAPTNIGVFLCPGGRSIFLGQKTKDKRPATLKGKGRKTLFRSVSFEVVINFPRRRACPARIDAGGMKGEDNIKRSLLDKRQKTKDKGQRTKDPIR